MGIKQCQVLVQLLPDEELAKLLTEVQKESLRRQAQNPGLQGPTFDSLVQRFGADGNKQLNINNLEQLPPAQRFELEQLPFQVDFDEELNVFVYTPRGYILDELIRLLRNEQVYNNLRELADGNIEILIEPMLHLSGRVHLRNLPMGQIITMNETLDDLVSWYKHTDTTDLTPVPYIGKSFDPDISLVEYKGHNLSTEHKCSRGVFTATPFLVGKYIDVIANSNTPELIAHSQVKSTVMLEQWPHVKSVFVEVGGHLIRMLTSRAPYARFLKGITEANPSVLDLRSAVNITKGMRDCFGNVMPWTELLGEEGVDLEIALQGAFDAKKGIVQTNNGVVNFTTYDPIGRSIVDLLKSTSRCLAYELDGTLV